MANKDIFINNKLFPKASDIFSLSGSPVSLVKSKCLFVLDTNALVLPYTTSSESVDEIKKVYTQIIKEKRLFVPGQVAREFAKTRPEKLKELFSKLTRKRSKTQNLYDGKFPLLNGLPEYDELINQEKEIDKQIKEYKQKIGAIIEHVRNWSWDDPVSQVYKSLFKENVVVDIEINEAEIEAQLKFRYDHKIPPGFEDENKGDKGIGDLLIWYTILHLAEEYNKDVVFVSGDEKKDWFYQSEGQALYPRFELITEFRTKAPNKSFNIIKLSELLGLFGANDDVVKELEIEEQEQNLHEIVLNDIVNNHQTHSDIEQKVKMWLLENNAGSYVMSNESGFPDIILSDDDGKESGVEILYVTRLDSYLRKRLTRMLSSSVQHARLLAYKKLLIVVVTGPVVMMEGINEIITEMKSRYDSKDLEIEILFGYINKVDMFTRLI
ncbi:MULTISPECIES: PIN domain-containing protein [Chryseobacterium]|uniref:PIN like domain-containing protein n=1 Tax=Chryseobacterium ureilyticum TaxID=373668 RepID=A0A1N7MFQ8_9FLAO|nr:MULTISPECIES: PIN domain-containing protein [Chryseobacterium]MDW9381125.1 hypothetical protein [Chryseobacterium sp. JV558]SIS84789.1 hypothetical protein SAMN05421786_102542 [Chryseobacterium ureilyticum]